VYKLITQYLLQKSQAKIIHFGSAGEYGKLNHAPNEKHVLNPMTIYHATKAGATNLILGFSYQFKIPVIILRCYSIFGPYENSTKFIPRLIRHFETNEKLTIYKGSQDYYYIDNLSKIVSQLIKKNSYFSKSAEIINIGSGKYIENANVYKIFGKLFKKKGNAKFINGYQKKTDNKIWVSNNKKLKSYNFIKEVNFIDGLKKYLKEIKSKKRLYNHIYQIKKY
jgi:nucleoside-diphosphate-sugar epimerase